MMGGWGVRGNSTLLLAAAICIPISLTGCKTTESAFDTDCKVGGTAIGAIVGGVAAGLLGKGNGRIGTALMGAAVGGFVGNQLGGMLDCQDKQALATASQSAGDAPVGQRIVWASNNADVQAAAAAPPPAASPPAAPMAEPALPARVTPSAAKPPTPRPKPPAQAKAAPREQPPAPSPAAPQADGQWAAVEPIRSGGQSGLWGWVEPVSAPATAADGRTCRSLKQVVVEPSGQQHDETVTSCLNPQQQWVVASR